MKSQSRFMSMDAPLGNESDDDFTLYDLMGMKDNVAPDNSLLKESLIKEINNTLKVLGERESQILRMYYGLDGQVPRTLEEIGEEFELTRERVRQLKEAVITSYSIHYTKLYDNVRSFSASCTSTREFK